MTQAKKTYRLAGRKAAEGTSLRGYVRTTYADLVAAFGRPTIPPSADGKVTAEWVLVGRPKTKFAGVVATIYDWKGDCRFAPGAPSDWHIGGLPSLSPRDATAFVASLEIGAVVRER